MICSTCGAADSPDKAAFCQLCLGAFGASAGPSAVAGAIAWRAPLSDREWWLRRRTEYVAHLEPGFSEHEWWVERRAELAYALEHGLPPRSSVYALASFDAEVRRARAQWWAASILILSAWIATVRASAVDWGSLDRRSLLAGAPAALQAIAAAGLGAVVTRAFVKWASGDYAWHGTLVGVLFWGPVVALLAAVAATAGVEAFRVVSLYAVTAVLVTAVVPVARGHLLGYLPRP